MDAFKTAIRDSKVDVNSIIDHLPGNTPASAGGFIVEALQSINTQFDMIIELANVMSEKGD